MLFYLNFKSFAPLWQHICFSLWRKKWNWSKLKHSEDHKKQLPLTTLNKWKTRADRSEVCLICLFAPASAAVRIPYNSGREGFSSVIAQQPWLHADPTEKNYQFCWRAKEDWTRAFLRVYSKMFQWTGFSPISQNIHILHYSWKIGRCMEWVPEYSA